MKKISKLDRESTGLIVIDVQEKLYPVIDRGNEVMKSIQTLVDGFHVLKLPIIVTEQAPKNLGSTVGTLKTWLGDKQEYMPKTCFSIMSDASIKEKLSMLPVKQWVLVGVEAHVCVLQTAKDLLEAGYEVIVPNDAIGSRSIYNFSTAISELQQSGARVSSTETILFELVKDSKAPEFKQISQLIK